MITFGNTSMPISLIAISLVLYVIKSLPFAVWIWFAVLGFRVHWGWGVANLLIPCAFIPFCILHPKGSKKPLILAGIYLAFFLIVWICAKNISHPHSRVEVSRGLPASATNAVLHLNLFATGISATNWNLMISHISSSFSLKWPDRLGDSDGGYADERLIAARADGFVIQFSKRIDGKTRTNVVLFPYDQTTDTNMLGWRIIGNFDNMDSKFNKQIIGIWRTSMGDVLVFDTNGSFRGTSVDINHTNNYAGTWRINNEGLALTPTNVAGPNPDFQVGNSVHFEILHLDAHHFSYMLNGGIVSFDRE